MTLLNAGFEVAPSGTTIPAGGTDGFTDEYTGPGTAFVSDSSVPAAVASGTYAGRMSVGASAAQNYREWPWSGGVVHLRQYIYLTASPSSRFTWWENYKNSSYVSRIRINTDRTVGLSNGSNTWLTTAPIPLNTLTRVEASFDHAAGTMSLALYVGNSATAISGGTVTRTGVAFTESTVSWLYGGIQSTLANYTIWTDAWAVSDVAQPGPLVSGGTVTGVDAPTVAASADGGEVLAVVGTTVTITGVTAQVVAQGGNTPGATVEITDPEWPPAPYREAMRSGGYSLYYSVDASIGGVPVEGAQDLRPTGGTITDTTKSGVRRVLNLELAPEPGLFDLLSPIGTTLNVTAKITYLDRSTLDIPMGVFDVDSERSSEGRGGISITAPDKWGRVQRARYLIPDKSTPGVPVQVQISAILHGALGVDEPINNYTTRQATVGALVWEKDRAKAIIELAESIGAWVYFDREGVFTIADIPTIGASADWLIDSGSNGVLVDLDRERSRTDTANVVVVESSAAEGALFPTQVVWDDDPASPTYAGPNPLAYPASGAGPFGIVTRYYDTPVLSDVGSARAAGMSILARVSGLASQVSLSQVQNPAVDAFDVIDVLPLRERYDIPRVLERHVVDQVTHPLLFGAQRIEGRSTRVEEIAGGS